MTTRRGFLGLLLAAPVAAPAIAKAAVSEMTMARGGWIRGISGSIMGEACGESMLTPGQMESLKMTIGGIHDALAPGYFTDGDKLCRRGITRIVIRDAPPLAPKVDAPSPVPCKLANQRDGRCARCGTGPCVLRHDATDYVQADSLQKHRLVYIGSPYTKYVTGIEAAFQDVCAITADLLRDGVKVYSPIAHTHPIAIHGNVDPLDHSIWLPFDRAMMDASDAMVIAGDMDGWDTSYGVQVEIDTFRAADKPVYMLKGGRLTLHL